MPWMQKEYTNLDGESIISAEKEVDIMITAELTQKINLLPQESYDMVENFVQQLLDTNSKKERAFQTFMDKMNAAERSVQEHGYYSEDEVEEELARI